MRTWYNMMLTWRKKKKTQRKSFLFLSQFSQSSKRWGCLSFLCLSDCSSRSVASSDPRTAYWALCEGPNEGKQDPILYTAPAGPQLGTPSLYSLKIRYTNGPKQRQKTVSLQMFFYYITSFLCFYWEHKYDSLKLTLWDSSIGWL